MSTQFLTRAERAQRILDAGMVHPVHPEQGIWRVDSEADADVSYAVNIQQHTCECPDHARGHTCKHELAAERAAEIYNRPAPAPRPELQSFTTFTQAVEAACLRYGHRLAEGGAA